MDISTTEGQIKNPMKHFDVIYAQKHTTQPFLTEISTCYRPMGQERVESHFGCEQTNTTGCHQSSKMEGGMFTSDSERQS
jgi:hypothetical protein